MKNEKGSSVKRHRLFLFFNIAATLIFIGVGTTTVWKLSTFGFSARRKPFAVEIWLARHARDLATPLSVKNLKNPIQATPLTIAEARDRSA